MDTFANLQIVGKVLDCWKKETHCIFKEGKK